MSETQIDTSGAVDILNRLNMLPHGVEAAFREVIGQLGTSYLGKLKHETPLGKGEFSPNLVKQYQVEQSYSATQASYTITNTTPYLKWVLNGRGPIVAKGRALRFVINGKVFFRKRVGPAKANNFPLRVDQQMQPAIDAAPQQLSQAILRRARFA